MSTRQTDARPTWVLVAAALAILIAPFSAQGTPPARSGGPGVATPNAGEERAALLAFLREHLGRPDRDDITRVSFAQVALHPGPERQFIVYVSSRYWCGSGGCSTLVVERGSEGFREVSGIGISRPPILVLESRTNGWRDLAVWVAGGGIQPGYQALLPFDGTAYATNPSVAPARPLPAGATGLAVIGEEAQGQPLFAGPSFDCGLASTMIEKTICKTPGLAALDLQLADAYRAILAAAPENRASLQASQAAWLLHRNGACKDGNDRCLEVLYRERVAELSEPPTRLALPLCHAVAERARSAAPQPRLDLVPLSEPVPGPHEATPAGWNAWGQRQQPPFSFDAASFSDSFWSRSPEILQVPGAQWYAATTLEGSGGCWHMVFFKNQDGLAIRAAGPPAWEATDPPGGGCGVRRGFGTVDGTVAGVETSTSPYDLEERITLARWDGERFGAPCELRLAYRPTFGPPTSDLFPEACGTGGCGPLRGAAADVVAELYRTGVERIGGPFRRRRTVDGIAYDVSASRATIGWRVFSDWEVTFQRADGKGETRKVVVDVGRGPLREAKVW